MKEIDVIRAKTREKIDNQSKETKQYVENLKRSVHLSKKLVDQGTDEEILSSKKMMLERANDLRKRQKYFEEITPVSKFDYTPCDSREPLHEEFLRWMEKSLGEVKEKNPQIRLGKYPQIRLGKY